MDEDFTAALIAWRRYLHAHPRLSCEEADTAAFVIARLREMGVEDIVAGVGGHGVVATLRRGKAIAAVGLRADMDALPIAEDNAALPWRSTVPGVMHACGHDGHTVALLGAARLLLKEERWSGTVHLIFQPAEEGGGGARAMIADGLFERFPMQRIFGWHNWPGLTAGTIAIHDSAIMAAAARFEITFRGHAAHAAQPHLARDPVVAAGHAIVAIQSLISRRLDPLHGGVVSLTMIEGGQAQNQIPASVTLRGTARWLHDSDGPKIRADLERIAKGVGAAFAVEVEFSFRQGVGVTANHPQARAIAIAAAAAVAELRCDLPPAMTGEDFSHFLAHVPGAFVWIGNGPAEAGRGLHHASYDFNDAILPVAARFLAEVARRSLATPVE